MTSHWTPCKTWNLYPSKTLPLCFSSSPSFHQLPLLTLQQIFHHPQPPPWQVGSPWHIPTCSSPRSRPPHSNNMLPTSPRCEKKNIPWNATSESKNKNKKTNSPWSVKGVYTMPSWENNNMNKRKIQIENVVEVGMCSSFDGKTCGGKSLVQY